MKLVLALFVLGGITTVLSFRPPDVGIDLLSDQNVVKQHQTTSDHHSDNFLGSAIIYIASTISGIITINIIGYLLHRCLPRVYNRALACLPPSLRTYLLPLLLFYLPVAVMCCCMRRSYADEELGVQMDRHHEEVELSEINVERTVPPTQQPSVGDLIVI